MWAQEDTQISNTPSMQLLERTYRGTPNSDSRLGPEASPVPLQPPLPQGIAGALSEADTHSASPAAGAPGTPDTPSVPGLPQLQGLEETIEGVNTGSPHSAKNLE